MRRLDFAGRNDLGTDLKVGEEKTGCGVWGGENLRHTLGAGLWLGGGVSMGRG